jgi:uncharacterized protein
MRNALHEQLLKAGLIDEKRLKDLERDQQRSKTGGPQHRPPGKKPGDKPVQRQAPSPHRPPQPPAPVAKSNAEVQAARRALERELAQIIKAGRLPHNDGDEVYNFVDGKKIGRIYVKPATQLALVKGEYVVVRLRTRYAIVTAETAALIAARAPEVVIAANASRPPDNEDPDYRDFPVPDDLRW